MKITLEWLKEVNACDKGVDWFKNKKLSDDIEILNALIADDKLDWINWVICRIFNREQKIRYGIYAAEQVLDIFEKKYPKDDRPRNAIEFARKCITDKSSVAAGAAEAATWAAKDAAKAAAWAAWSAKDAAWAAAWAARDAAWAAAGAADAAAKNAAGAAEAAAEAAAGDVAGAVAKTKMQLKILEYGISLLKETKP